MPDLITGKPPVWLQHLDVDAYGDVIAWARARDSDGTPQPYLDGARRDTCWAERRCGVCYLELDYRFGFLIQSHSPEHAKTLRWHLQAAVHPRCAPYTGMDAHPGMTVYLCLTRSYEIRLWDDPALQRRTVRKAFSAPYTKVEELPVQLSRRADGTKRSPSGLIVP